MSLDEGREEDAIPGRRDATVFTRRLRQEDCRGSRSARLTVAPAGLASLGITGAQILGNTAKQVIELLLIDTIRGHCDTNDRLIEKH